MTNYENKIFELTNAERRKHGLKTLVWSDMLANIARAHSLDLATNNIFSHTGFDGTTPEQRLHRANIAVRFMGENISGGRNSPEAAIIDWMTSAGHRANILNVDTVYLGVGAVYFAASRYKIYVVQIFGA